MPYFILVPEVLSLCNFMINLKVKCSCGSVVEHCISSAKVVGSIPREHTYWQKKCIAWMHCKSLWIQASAKCINVNYGVQLMDAVCLSKQWQMRVKPCLEKYVFFCTSVLYLVIVVIIKWFLRRKQALCSKRKWAKRKHVSCAHQNNTSACF